MAIPAMQAAKTICILKDWEVTHLEVQKILYFAHMFFVGEYNTADDVKDGDVEHKLINEKFQAWGLGPVCVDLYHQLKNNGRRNLPEFAFDEIGDLAHDTEEYQIINETCDMLKDFNPGRLIVLTHDKYGAWRLLHNGVKHVDIPNEEIYKEYQRRTASE